MRRTIPRQARLRCRATLRRPACLGNARRRVVISDGDGGEFGVSRMGHELARRPVAVTRRGVGVQVREPARFHLGELPAKSGKRIATGHENTIVKCGIR